MGDRVKGISNRKARNFAAWLESQDQAKLRAELGVSQMTLYYWRTGYCNPSVRQMKRIFALTKGLVSYQMMVERPELSQPVGSR